MTLLTTRFFSSSSLQGAMALASVLSLGACIIQEGGSDSPDSPDSPPLADAGAVEEVPMPSLDPDAPFLRITPNKIKLGESAVISYQAKDGAYCRIMQGIGFVGTEGQAVVTPTRSMTYVYDCPGGPGPVTLSATLEVEGADISEACGQQGNDVALRAGSAAQFTEGSVPASINYSLIVDGTSTVCAVACTEPWITATLVDIEDDPIALPGNADSQSTIRFEMLDSNLNEERKGSCSITTAGGDLDFEVTIVPAST